MRRLDESRIIWIVLDSTEQQKGYVTEQVKSLVVNNSWNEILNIVRFRAAKDRNLAQNLIEMFHYNKP